MSNYLELTQLQDGTIVLRRSDDHENPIVKIEFSGESKEFLNGEELSVAKEMIRAGIEVLVETLLISMIFLIARKKA